MPLRIKTITLGCKVNQYETEYVRQGLHAIGYADAAASEPADLCIVNTCTVTNEGDAKSRQLIRRMHRENPAARIVVMGCYATRDPQAVGKLPGVAEVITDKRELPDWLGRHGVIDVPTGISTFPHRRRAFVKVQDGCLLRCSYCIIPQVRPHVSSRPPEHICKEIERLVDGGCREVVLTGVHLGHYGVEQNAGKPRGEWLRLARLLREIMRLPGDFRVRLSSIEATEVTRELIDVLAEHADRVCPHLHICLQSGSDRILRAMRRRWSVKMFLDRCQLVAERLPQPAFTTDVIVGFPGETEDDFAATCRAVRAAGFCKVHIFPFSPRRGTPACDMPEQVPPEVRADRAARLLALERELRAEFARSLIGRTLTVMAEGRPLDAESPLVRRFDPRQVATGQVLAGTSCRHVTVAFLGRPEQIGRLTRVEAVAADSEGVAGRMG